MSSARRAGNEINILAMLDRQEGGGLRKRVLRGLRGRPDMFWYGAAGVLVCGLVGTLAWLAGDSGTPAPVNTALAGAVTSGGRHTHTPAQAPAPASPASAAPRGGATIVDLARVAEPPAQTPPQVSPAPMPALPAAAARVLPPPQHAGRIAPRDILHEMPRLAAHPATARSAPRPATAKPAAGAGVHLTHGETRGRRPAPPAKDAPAPVDTDVALISAIIQHANKRQESDETARKP